MRSVALQKQLYQNWVSLEGIYNLDVETESKLNLTMPLPIASITSNPTFHSPLRPPVKIHMAALRKRAKLVQPHPV